MLYADVHVFRMSPELDARGCYLLRDHALATFRFAGVIQLKLSDFNHQNQLAALRIQDITDRQWEWSKFAVTFAGSSGMDAEFFCGAVTVVSARPFDPRRHPVSGAMAIGPAGPLPEQYG